MNKFISMVLVVLSLFSCSSSTETETMSSLEGNWKLSKWGYTNIKTTDNSLTFLGDEYKGSFSGKSFTGTKSDSQNGVSYKATLNITLVSDDKISGSYKSTITMMGETSTTTDHFTGTRE